MNFQLRRKPLVNGRFVTGFTLIELLVVISIIIILTFSAFASFRSGDKQLALQRSASKLAQDLRRAQEMAMSSKEVSGVVPDGFGIYFDLNQPEQYILFADLDGNRAYSGAGEMVDKPINTENQIKISALSPVAVSSLNIVFVPPDPVVWINGVSSGVTAQITLVIKNDPSSNKFVTANNVGLISVNQEAAVPPPVAAPTVVTNAATPVEETTATLNGNVTATGGENPTRYFDWDIDSGAPYADQYNAGAGGIGAYSYNLSFLSKGTLHYFRARAVNSAGAGNGSELTFLTKPDQPSGFTAAPGNTQIALNWTKGTGAGKTLIRRSTIAFPATISDGTQVYFNTGTSYTDTGLTNGTTYYYSAWSSTTAGIWTQVSDAYISVSGVPTASPILYTYYNVGHNSGYATYGVIWNAQTFTPSVAHTVTSVKLLLYRSNSPGTITVSIRATDGTGHPTGADLCSGTTDGNTLPITSPYEWRGITMSAGCNLTAGIKYAIVFRVLGGNSSNYAVWRINTAGTYSGGDRESSSNSGSTWLLSSGRDFMFEEWGI